jgi:hypothetical protein
MLTGLGFAALIGIIGTFAGILWAGVVVLAGLPGSSLVRTGTRYRKPAVISAGSVLTAIVELYLLLAFAGATSGFVAEFLAQRPALPAWPLWLAGWYLATTPVLFSGWNAPGAQARDERDLASSIALPVAAVGYWVFVAWPRVFATGWPWVPGIGW